MMFSCASYVSRTHHVIDDVTRSQSRSNFEIDMSGRFNYEGLVPHKQYFAGTLLGMSSCASYVSRTDDVIDDVTRSQSR